MKIRPVSLGPVKHDLTIHIKDSDVSTGNEKKNKIFEFTPISYGSDYYGYRTDHPLSFNKAISISGAAADSKLISNGFLSMITSAVNFDLGYYIENYNLSSMERTLPKFLPFPFYFMSGRHQKDINGSNIYLADGGHVENLGAYSLIRRLTQNIIIVDADHDPEYKFEAYFNLKQSVLQELGAVLSVKEIEDNYSCSNYFGKHPVMTGTISSFPFSIKDGDVSRDVKINIVYLKLSIDQEKVINRTYPISITNYYHMHKEDDTNYINKHGKFPQQSTSDQTYDIFQLSAFRDLGFEIVKGNRKIFEQLLQ